MGTHPLECLMASRLPVPLLLEPTVTSHHYRHLAYLSIIFLFAIVILLIATALVPIPLIRSYIRLWYKPGLAVEVVALVCLWLATVALCLRLRFSGCGTTRRAPFLLVMASVIGTTFNVCNDVILHYDNRLNNMNTSLFKIVLHTVPNWFGQPLMIVPTTSLLMSLWLIYYGRPAFCPFRWVSPMSYDIHKGIKIIPTAYIMIVLSLVCIPCVTDIIMRLEYKEGEVPALIESKYWNRYWHTGFILFLSLVDMYVVLSLAIIRKMLNTYDLNQTRLLTALSLSFNFTTVIEAIQGVNTVWVVILHQVSHVLFMGLLGRYWYICVNIAVERHKAKTIPIQHVPKDLTSEQEESIVIVEDEFSCIQLK